MAKYTTKRTYTKKPTTTLKKVVKKVKQETVQTVEAVAEVPAVVTPVAKSFWQKAADWVKGLIK